MRLHPSPGRTLNSLEQRVLALMAKSSGETSSGMQEQGYNVSINFLAQKQWKKSQLLSVRIMAELHCGNTVQHCIALQHC